MAEPVLSDLLQQLIYLKTLASHNALTPEDTTKLQQVTDTINKADPSAVTTAYNALDPGQQKIWEALVTTEKGATGAGVTGTVDANGNRTYSAAEVGQMIAQSALNQGAGGGDLSISAQAASQMRGTSAQRDTAVVYQDLPTPEEYMNNWDNAFSAHVAGMRATGALSNEAAAWAQGQSTMFYGNYIRAQLKDALAGKPMFKLTGLDPENKLMGTRQGAFASGTSQQQQQTQESLHQTSSGKGQISNIALDSLLRRTTPGSSLGTSARVGAVQSGGGGAIDINSRGTADNLTNTLQSQQEAIVQRNKLGVVANLAPLDFLKDNMDAGKLNLLYQGQKGTQAAATQISSAEEPVRRVG